MTQQRKDNLKGLGMFVGFIAVSLAACVGVVLMFADAAAKNGAGY